MGVASLAGPFTGNPANRKPTLEIDAVMAKVIAGFMSVALNEGQPGRPADYGQEESGAERKLVAFIKREYPQVFVEFLSNWYDLENE